MVREVEKPSAPALMPSAAMRAMAAAFNHLRVVIEPGGAVALAAALFHPREIEGDTVIAVASGGNVDAEVYQGALSRFA